MYNIMKRGDVNNDNSIGTQDATYLLEYLVGNPNYTLDISGNLNINGNTSFEGETTFNSNTKFTGVDIVNSTDATQNALIINSNGELEKVAFDIVCFLPDTKITLSNYNDINIQNIQKGDKLLSYKFYDMDPYYKSIDVLSWFSDNDDGQFSESVVENIWLDESPSYLILNDKLRVTCEHLIFTKIDDEYTWLSAKNIRIGDIVFNN